MMTILGTVARVVGFLFDALMLVILINALLSWIQPRPHNAFVNVVERIADTVCNPIRRYLPVVVGGFDLSPIVAMLALSLVKSLVLRVLLG